MIYWFVFWRSSLTKIYSLTFNKIITENVLQIVTEHEKIDSYEIIKAMLENNSRIKDLNEIKQFFRDLALLF